MDNNKETIKSLELKIKLLEIENQKLFSIIELNNKEIEQIKSIIKSFSEKDSPLTEHFISNNTLNSYNKVINLEFEWKVNDKGYLTHDMKTVKKISGGESWNCTSLGNKSLIKGKINKWKIQIIKLIGSITFGIVPKGIDINGVNNWMKGYITCSGNFYKHNLGVCSKPHTLIVGEGSILETIVDLEKGVLSFSMNGNNLGIFCDNIIKDIEYIPFLDIYNEGTEVRLL